MSDRLSETITILNEDRVRTTFQKSHLCDVIKRLGYGKGRQVSLYGMRFVLVSDQFSIGTDLVFVDAEELESGQRARVRLPTDVVRRAEEI